MYYRSVAWAPCCTILTLGGNTIFRYLVDWSIYDACRAGEWKRELPPQQWWWEQKMCLDDKDADGADK
jgi:hypothetical protein